jgi:hypothetical protein
MDAEGQMLLVLVQARAVFSGKEVGLYTLENAVQSS